VLSAVPGFMGRGESYPLIFFHVFSLSLLYNNILFNSKTKSEEKRYKLAYKMILHKKKINM
jgi:hypothetical protein